MSSWCNLAKGRFANRRAWRGGRRWKTAVFMALIVVCCTLEKPLAEETRALWKALESKGHVALLRHAIAPGTGDPSSFKIGDCSTQRNLSDTGREQAARIGARFVANGIKAARIFSSQWCRCMETATLLGLGPVQELPALNSFFETPERRNDQTLDLRDWLASEDLNEPLVLVTHQVNITALTRVYPTSGELVVVRRSESGELSVLGTLETE